TKLGVAAAARLAIVHVMVPVLPTAGSGQAHPPGKVMLTKVLLGGIGSVTVTFAAAAGPRFVTTDVNATLLPALTVGLPLVTATCKSLWVPVAMVVVAVAVLLAAFRSSESEETVAVCVSLPVVVFVTVKTIVPLVDAASEGPLQVNTPPL